MPQTKVAVVIPTHKTELNPLEKISLTQCRKVLGRYQIIFVLPDDKNFSFLEPSDKFARLSPQFFKSVRTYNQLMMFTEFYKMFSDYGYDYILIHELDAFVFSNKLEYFCNLGYDYIGAPWPMMYAKSIDGKRLRVGNSGFSLRNVKAHYNLLTEHADLVKSMMGKPNDVFYAYCGARDDCNFNVAPIDIAYKFSAEYNPARVVKKNGGELPFGCHAWDKYAPEFYTETFYKFGYDLRPFQNLLTSSDDNLTSWLTELAIKRLERRIHHGQSIARYLSTKCFDSVRVVRDPFVMAILSRLIEENNSLADKIFIYAPDEQDILLHELTPQRQPHLLITSGRSVIDKQLTAAIEKNGLTYSKRVVSFQREYLNRCEELFHNLGK